MRGAGSTYNDIIDRDIDAKVERTKWRPLASGRIGATAAAVFLAAQCLAGLAVLLSFNGFTILLGFASLGVVGLYPFMKRISSWPQAVLGAAFAWGALIGWAAALGSLASAPLLLYLGAVFWTIGYDTIYAVQDIEDDALAGIGSTARLFGERLPLGIGSLFALAVVFIEAALLAAGPRATERGHRHVGGLRRPGLCGDPRVPSPLEHRFQRTGRERRRRSERRRANMACPRRRISTPAIMKARAFSR